MALEAAVIGVTGGLWLVFVVYWVIAAVGVKRNAGGWPWRREIGLRVAVILLIALLWRSHLLRRSILQPVAIRGHSAILGLSGVALCLVGFALAISARRELGRNWGLPMTRKESPEVVTTGPYALIRHPIYTGLMLALLGSAMAIRLFWALLLVVIGPYFIYSARREEGVMLQLFPEQYAAYRARTGMFVPSLLSRRK